MITECAALTSRVFCFFTLGSLEIRVREIASEFRRLCIQLEIEYKHQIGRDLHLSI